MQFSIIWWITVITDSELYLGLASFLGFGSMMVTIPFAGVFVDRWNRKVVLAVADGLQAIATVGLIVLFALDIATIMHVLLVLTIRGFLNGFHLPAVQAIIPAMVPKDKLTQINSLDYFANGIIQAIGPVVGAILIGLFGVDNLDRILWLDAITFLIAVLPLLLISIPDVRKPKETDQSFSEEFKEGIVFIKNSNGLLTLLTLFTSINFFSSPVYIFLPLLVSRTEFLGGDEILLGFVLGISQVGVIIGALLMAKVKLFSSNVLGVLFGLAFIYMTYFVLIYSSVEKSVFLFLLAMFVGGLALPIANVSSQNIWQTAVPLELQARVFSARLVIAQGLGALSMLMAGFLAELVGIIPLLLWSQIIGSLILFASWARPSLRSLEENIQQMI